MTLELQHSVALFAVTARFRSPPPRGIKLRRLDETLEINGVSRLRDIGAVQSGFPILGASSDIYIL